jgi:hypothetical protein
MQSRGAAQPDSGEHVHATTNTAPARFNPFVAFAAREGSGLDSAIDMAIAASTTSSSPLQQPLVTSSSQIEALRRSLRAALHVSALDSGTLTSSPCGGSTSIDVERALGSLSMDDGKRPEVADGVSSKDIPKLVGHLGSVDGDVVLEAVERIRKMLMLPHLNDSVNKLLEAGVIKPLVQLLSCLNTTIDNRAWSLAAFGGTAGPSVERNHRRRVVGAGQHSWGDTLLPGLNCSDGGAFLDSSPHGPSISTANGPTRQLACFQLVAGEACSLFSGG